MTSRTPVRRDKTGKFIYVPEDFVNKKTKLWTSTELSEDFAEHNNRELYKYNKFIEWTKGVPVAPNFPYDVRLCVSFSPERPRSNDYYEVDPIPKSWVLAIQENPLTAPVLPTTRYNTSAFKINYLLPYYPIDIYRYETLEAAYEVLKDIDFSLKLYFKDMEVDTPRQISCPRCGALYDFNDTKNAPQANVKLDPLFACDILLHHECGKTF